MDFWGVDNISALQLVPADLRCARISQHFALRSLPSESMMESPVILLKKATFYPITDVEIIQPTKVEPTRVEVCDCRISNLQLRASIRRSVHFKTGIVNSSHS